jgi:hypothetical protein
MAWFIIIFCFIGLLLSAYGFLLYGASFLETRIGKPIYERLSEGGRKNYWKFVLLALPICFVYKMLSRFPIWFGMFYLFTFVGVKEPLLYQFLGFLIFAGALAKVAEEGKYYFPKEIKPTKPDTSLSDLMHKALYPNQYK